MNTSGFPDQFGPQNAKDMMVVIWANRFPFQNSASNEKNLLIAKSLMNSGIDVTLTSKLPFQNRKNLVGVFEGVPFINFYNIEIRNKYFAYINAIVLEIIFIKKLKKEFKNVYVFGSYVFFPIYICYAMICKIVGARMVLHIMEWHISVYKHSSFLKRINAFFFDHFARYISAGSIVISNFINEKFGRSLWKHEMISIPALANVKRIESILNYNQEQDCYLLYSGSVGYLDVIMLIIDSYIASEKYIEQHLMLILHGDEEQIKFLRDKLRRYSCADKIVIKSNLSYELLIQNYKGAEALLVPLRNTNQDKARYPQKIAEYAACGRPIISNSIGQVGIDFSHNENIYFAADFSVESFSKALIEVLNNEELKIRIAYGARLKAEEYFDCYIYSEKLMTFLNKIK